MNTLAQSIPAERVQRHTAPLAGTAKPEEDIYSRAHAPVSPGRMQSQSVTAMRAQQPGRAELVGITVDARYPDHRGYLQKQPLITAFPEPNKLTAAMDKVILKPLAGRAGIPFQDNLIFVLAINIGRARKPLFEGGSDSYFH